MPQALRLYVDQPLLHGGLVTLSAEQAHYTGSVMRRRRGDALLLFNGRDGEWSAAILNLERGRGAAVVDTLRRPQQAGPDLWLAFALLKRDATDMVVQKATELGVSAILPVITERTNATRVNIERLVAIAIEAAEQSERLTVPRVRPPQPLPHLLADWPDDRTLFAAVERLDATPLRPATGPAGLLVGPEGGFAQPEVRLLERTPSVRPISLGRLVLRAETACMAGLVLLQAPGYG